jgi:hypothetical protein
MILNCDKFCHPSPELVIYPFIISIYNTYQHEPYLFN